MQDDGESSDKFDLEQSLRQGCVFVPLLFYTFLTSVLGVAGDGFLAIAIIINNTVQLANDRKRKGKNILGTSRTNKTKTDVCVWVGGVER